MHDTRGFTLIELLVVIGIIGVLTTLGAISYTNTISRARDTQRITDARNIKLALDAYFADHGSFPNPGGSWRGECDHPWGTPNLAPNQVIPGLVPQYLEEFPSDPQMNIAFSSTSTPCYLYRSNGTDYALLLHGKHIGGDTDYMTQKHLLDTYRDGGSNTCVLDGTAFWSWKLSTPGARCW